MDDTPREEMQRQRTAREDSKYRTATEAENQARFAAMLKGGEEGARWCLRARMNMQDDNGTCRDPVLYRVNETPHHRTGTKYKAYPTYDFACPIVDSLEGVTHALRSSEYHDRDIQFYRLQVRGHVCVCVCACVCGRG
jgi:glutamyl-tRNA synthetase